MSRPDQAHCEIYDSAEEARFRIDMFEKRVIIGGLARAGTTLFRKVLNSTSQVICAPETGFFLQPLSVQQERSKRVARRVNRALEIGETKIEDVIRSSRSSLECYDRLMVFYCDQAGVSKRCWSEKTPRNCHSYAWLAREDPGARFISLIRDGRDVVTSVLDGRTDYHVSIQRYVETMEFIYAFDSPRHLLVRYEEMVREPVKCFQRVFEFIGLPFEREAVQAYTQPTPTDIEPERAAAAKISTARIGRWNHSDHAERVAAFLADERARRWMGHSGYDIGD